jgi:hypothetical protein
MKKIIVLLAVLALTFAVIIPASANGNGSGGKGTSKGSGIGLFSGTNQIQQGQNGAVTITGTIAAIGTDNVTINVVGGNKLVQPYLGTPLTLAVTSNTSYLLRDGTTVTITALMDLKVGQAVSANVTVINNIWTASRITVGASLTCLP